MSRRTAKRQRFAATGSARPKLRCRGNPRLSRLKRKRWRNMVRAAWRIALAAGMPHPPFVVVEPWFYSPSIVDMLREDIAAHAAPPTGEDWEASPYLPRPKR